MTTRKKAPTTTTKPTREKSAVPDNGPTSKPVERIEGGYMGDYSDGSYSQGKQR